MGVTRGTGQLSVGAGGIGTHQVDVVRKRVAGCAEAHSIRDHAVEGDVLRERDEIVDRREGVEPTHEIPEHRQQDHRAVEV